MAVRKTAGMRGRQRGKGIRATGDGLSTTPTQYGDKSPDYVKQAGDPTWMRSYSEEQIGLMGGRSRMIELANASQERAASRAAAPGSAEAETASVGAVAFDEVGTTDIPTPSEGPTTAPTTYGRPIPKPGAAGAAPKPTGIQNALTRGKGKKKGLYKRLAKTTGTTVGEAQGLMKGVRKQVRRGNKAGAKRTIARALSGGPKAGVPRSPQRTAKAQKAATKITKRIATRQAQPTPRRRKK